MARRRGRRELRDVPGHPARPGRAHQRRARPPRLLRHLRGACGTPSPTFLAGAGRGAVVCADDPEAAAIGREHGAITVGTGAGSTYPMGDLDLQRSSVSFTLRGPEGELGTLRIGVPGLHNARNAAVAAVAALQAGAPFAAAQAALARFAGVTRRFEFRGESRGVTFVDDYAHLPTEVRAALATARSGRLVPRRRRVPAPPFLADGRAGRPVRDRLRRRRRPGGHRRLQRRRTAGPRGLGPARGRRRAGAGPDGCP